MTDDSKDAKRRRALNLFIESVINPDHELRGDAHGQECYYELMEVREEILSYLRKR